MDAELEKLKTHYAPFVYNIIEGNRKFFNSNLFDFMVRFDFFCDERIANFAKYDSKKDVVGVNLFSADYAYSINKPLYIEFYLLHELRHRFQWFIVCAGDMGGDVGVYAEEAKVWKKEWTGYKKPVSHNESLEAYSKQSMEFDANVYAYAVMQYKYGDIPYLKDCIPKCYGKNFYEKADEWCQRFREMGI